MNCDDTIIKLYQYYDTIMKKGLTMIIEVDKSIKKLLQKQIDEYKDGNRKALSVILNLIKKDIAKLILENELTIKLTKEIIEDSLNIEIKDDTFYKWVRRNIKNSVENIKKSNIKGEESIINKSKITFSKSKQKKEVQDESAKVKEVKKDKKIDVEEFMNNKKIANDLFNKYNKF